MKVLIVDDELPVRQRLAEAIAEIPDTEVEVEEPVKEKVDRHVLQSLPAVILVDIHKPIGRGLDLVQQIKMLHYAPPAVIIALSDTPSLAYRVRCHEAGAAFFFDRIHEQDRLLQAIVSIKEELGW